MAGDNMNNNMNNNIDDNKEKEIEKQEKEKEKEQKRLEKEKEKAKKKLMKDQEKKEKEEEEARRKAEHEKWVNDSIADGNPHEPGTPEFNEWEWDRRRDLDDIKDADESLGKYLGKQLALHQGKGSSRTYKAAPNNSYFSCINTLTH